MGSKTQWQLRAKTLVQSSVLLSYATGQNATALGQIVKKFRSLRVKIGGVLSVIRLSVCQ